jgi:hypothetical protein
MARKETNKGHENGTKTEARNSKFKKAAEALLAYSPAAGAETPTQTPTNHAHPTQWIYGEKTLTISNPKPKLPTPKLHPSPVKSS